MSHVWPLRPSFAAVWGECAGAVKASVQFPSAETDATRNGTAAHWVVAEVLEACKIAPAEAIHMLSDCSRFLGKTAPNGVVIDDEMFQGAQVMVDDVLELAGERLHDVVVEHAVHIPTVHPQNGGTLDAALWVPEEGRLILWDYKNGHRKVKAEGNKQFVEYLEGLREQIGINGHTDQQVRVMVRAVQPHAYQNKGPLDVWECWLSDIRPIVNRLNMKAAEAMSENPTITAGLHCRDCPALGKCSASREYVYGALEIANRPYEMDEMTIDDLATERNILKDVLAVAKRRAEAIEDDLTHRIQGGEFCKSLRLDGSYGNEEYTIPPKQAAALASQFGFNIMEEKVKTPTQARAACPKKHKAAFNLVLDKFTRRPPRGMTLTEAEGSTAARAFSKK